MKLIVSLLLFAALFSFGVALEQQTAYFDHDAIWWIIIGCCLLTSSVSAGLTYK
jgi:hypothetical protein